MLLVLIGVVLIVCNLAGWGPMANPQVPGSPGEEREQKRQTAEVDAVRAQVWVANASLRAPYELENIGATSDGSVSRTAPRAAIGANKITL